MAVLSHAYWQARFDESSAVVGDTLIVNGQAMTIVGVAPQRFDGTVLGQQPQVFVPLAEATEMLQLQIDGSMLLFASGLTVTTGLVFGIVPALHSTRPDLAGTLKGQAGQPAGACGASRFRASLATAQIALSMTLLVLAGLFTKSLLNVGRIDLGLQVDDVVTFRVSPVLSGYTPEQTRALFERVEDELATLPGVAGVTASTVPLLAGSNWGNNVSVEGFAAGPDSDTKSFYVCGPADRDQIVSAVPAIVARLDANLPVEDLRTMREQVRENVAVDRLVTTLSAAFAVLATLLAAVGLYGVLAYTVAQRTREIGLRMALGADAPRIRRMVLAQVGWMTIAGGLAGMLGALVLGRVGASLLFELEAHDPLVLAAAAVALALVALGAGFIPAYRASSIEPMRALRYE